MQTVAALRLHACVLRYKQWDTVTEHQWDQLFQAEKRHQAELAQVGAVCEDHGSVSQGQESCGQTTGVACSRVLLIRDAALAVG